MPPRLEPAVSDSKSAPPREEVACWCGATAATRLWGGRYSRNGFTDYAYQLLRCRDCGLARTTPCPGGGDPVSLYQGYGEQLVGREAEARGWYAPRVADLRRLLPPPARILDVGGNIGTMVGMLSEAGYAAEGMDVDRGAIAHGRSLGRTLWAGELPTPQASAAEGPTGRYDAVIASHTLEHVLRPAELVGNAAQWLRSGGLLVIYVPNFASFAAQALRSRWLYLAPPHHLWQFTPRSLVAAVRRTVPGLTPVWVRSNTRMESSDAASWWKRALRGAALESAARLGWGDEIRAAFQLTAAPATRPRP